MHNGASCASPHPQLTGDPVKNTLAPLALSAALAGGLFLAPAAHTHFNDKEAMQSYRQSYFALVAMNFGPLAAMAKGEMPYDADMATGFASDLAAVAALNVERGFPESAMKGTTRAKPEIWENMDDFKTKLQAMRDATGPLVAAAGSGDRKTLGQAVGAVGKTCKGCHDEYKSKDYLY